MKQRLIITLIIALFLCLGTLAAIFWAKGYRPSFKEKTIKGTSLLVVNSYPEGASVYLNDKLTTATNDTLHLPPGDYKVKIVKDGFAPWQKELKLKSELVFQTNARLFPTVPDLTALTFSGAINPTPSPNGQKIVYAVASASASLKNGLWVLNMSDSPIRFGSNNIQITQSTTTVDFSQAEITWSPNSQEILVSLPLDHNFLLPADSMTKPGNLKDVSARLPLILEEWQEELALSKQKRLEKLPPLMQKTATASAQFSYFSPDETKLLYLAKEEVALPEGLLPPVPATNTQTENREIKSGGLYVYDIKEDKNFFIKEIGLKEEPEKEKAKSKTQTATEKSQEILNSLKSQYNPLFFSLPQWLSTSQHLIFTEENKINLIEYDGTNSASVYIGGFEENFVFPWPAGNKLIILTSLNAPIINLYAINLR